MSNHRRTMSKIYIISILLLAVLDNGASDVSIQASSYVVELGRSIDLTVTVPADGVMHTVDFGDDNFVLQCDNSSQETYSVVFSHNYTELGAFLPYVESFIPNMTTTYLDRKIIVKRPLTSISTDIVAVSDPLPVNASLEISLVNVDADTMINNCTVAFNTTFTEEPITLRDVTFDVTENGTTVSGTVPLVLEWIHINASSVDVKVTCTNGLHAVESSLAFTKKAAVSNIRFTADVTFLYLDNNVTFTVEHDGGDEGFCYQLDFGDGDLSSDCSSGPATISKIHSYTAVGIHTSSLRMNDSYMEEIQTIEITVEYLPPKLNYTFPDDDMILYPADSAVFVIHNIDDVNHPSIKCTWNFNDSHILNLEFPSNFTNGDYHAVVQDFDPENPGMHRISISCTDGLAWLNETHYVLYGRKLDNVSFALEETARIFPVNHPVLFSVSGIYGSYNTTYGFNWGDNHTGIQIMPEHENFHVTYDFPIGGNYTPYVEILEAGNITTYWENASNHITIQELIQDVLLSDTLDVASGPRNYNFSLVNPGPKIPSQIFCEWSCDDEPTVGVYYGDMAVDKPYTFQCDYGSTVGEVSVKVNCSNLFSHQYLEKTVTTYQELSDVSISLLTPSVITRDDVILFQINATGGTYNPLYTVVFGDGVIYIERKEQHVNFNVSHIYSVVGNYSVTLLASDDWGTFYLNLTETVIVQNAITSLSLTLTDALLGYPGSAEAILVANIDNGPTDVHCDVNFPNMQNVYSFASNFSSLNSVNVEGALGQMVTFGENVVEANCSNLISNSSANASCIVEENVEIAFASYERYAAVMDTVIYNVTLITGSHAAFVSSDESGTNITCYSESTRKCQLSLTYSSSGIYNFSVLVYNNVSSDEYVLLDAVTVRCPIKGVSVTAPSFVAYPSSSVSFLVQSDEVTCPPDGAKLLWENNEDSINVTKILDINAGYQFEKTYTYYEVGSKTETLLVCNEVSSQVVSKDLTIIEVLNGTTLLLDRSMAGQQLPISITASVNNGSHLTYDISYGDGNQETKVFDQAMDVRNQQHTFQHAFATVGNFTITLNVSNRFGFEVVQTYIHVVNSIPKLTLQSNGPVLTPPGHISYILNGSTENVPNDVICMWEFGDDNTIYSHTGNLNLPMTVEFQYEPTYETFKSSLQTTVTCENPANNQNATLNTVIEGNAIIMNSITNNGPLQPYDIGSSILVVEKHGYDACFVFQVDDETYLAGAAECTSRFNETYISFQEVSNETERLQSNFTINTVGVFSMTVTAFNGYHSVQINDEILILEEKCDPPIVGLGTIGLQYDTPKSSLKSRNSVTRGSVEIICFHDYRYKCSWTIKRVINMEDGVFENVTNVPNPSSPVLLAPALSLDIGVYWVTLTVTMELLPILVETTENVYLQILQTPISVSLAGGSSRIMKYTEQASFQAILDDPDMEIETPSYKWLCTPQSQEDMIDSFDWVTAALITNNCSAADGDFTVSNDSLTFDPMVLSSLEIVVAVYAEKRNRIHTIKQVVTFDNSDPLWLSVKCHRNCRKRVNWGSLLYLQSECLNCHPTESLNTVWTITPTNGTGKLFDHNVTKATFPDGSNSYMKVKGGGLEENMMYLIQVYAVTLNGEREGTLEIEITTSVSPSGGTCASNVPGGRLMIDNFKAVCSGWILPKKKRRRRKRAVVVVPEEELLNYDVFVGITNSNNTVDWLLVSFGNDPTSSAVLMSMGGENITLVSRVGVIDQYGTTAYTGLFLGVTEVFNGSILNTTNAFYEMDKAAYAGDTMTLSTITGAILSLIQNGIIGESYSAGEISTDGYITGGLDGLDPTLDDPTATAAPLDPSAQIMLRSVMLAQLSRLNPQVDAELDTLAALLRMLTSEPQFVTRSAQFRVADLMFRMIKVLERIHASITPERTQKIINDVSTALSNVMVAATGGVREEFKKCDQQNLCSNVDEYKEGLDILIMSFMNTFDIAGDIVASLQSPGEPFYLDDMSRMSFSVGKTRANRDMLYGYNISSTRGSITLSNQTNPLPEAPSNSCVQIQYLSFDDNPFLWGPGYDDVNLPVQRLTAKPCEGGPFYNFSTASVLSPYIVTAVALKELTPDVTVRLDDTQTLHGFHDMHKEVSSSHIQIFINTTKAGVKFRLYLKLDEKPNVNNYDWTLDIGHDNVKNHIIFVPNKETIEIGTYWLAVQVLGDENVKHETYTFTYQFVSCSLWSDSLDTWDSTQCQVSANSERAVTRFTSVIFASTFGAGLFVGPNTIDFGSVFDNALEKLAENIHVIVTIIVFFMLYVALLPYARHMDKKDSLRWALLPIIGIPPGHEYEYELYIYTGITSGAGTDSKVHIAIGGSDGSSGVLLLDDGERKNFRRGAMNKFLVRTKISLGRLMCVRIFHDNSGKGARASWYLERIIIVDKATKKRYLFICDNWLAVEKGDGLTDRVIPNATREQVYETKTMFAARSKKHLIEDHLWISVFYRRSQDEFTRMQRLSCGISLLFMTMIANAMWFGREMESGKTTGLQIGPMSFTLQTIWVSVASLLTVLPVTIAMVYLFNHHQIKTNKQSDSKVDETNAKDFTDINEKDETKKPKKRPQRFLPHFFLYVAWILVPVILLASSFFTILYSMEWGGEKSRQWLGAFLLALVEGEGIVAPLQAVALALALSVFCKRPVDDVEEEFDKEDTYVWKDGEGPSPADVERKEKMKQRRILEVKLNETLKQIAFHFTFLVALILVVYGNRESYTFRANESLTNTFYNNKWLKLVKQPSETWTWLIPVVLPYTYPQEDYNHVSLAADDQAFLGDQYNYRLGAPILRQYRVKPDQCSGPALVSRIKCNVDLGYSTQQNERFDVGWTPLVNQSAPVEGILRAYTYENSGTFSRWYWGEYNSYFGGGYAVNLRKTYSEASSLLSALEAGSWLDMYTRALVLEFNLYNANVNLFSMVSILIEFPENGGAYLHNNIQSVALYRYTGVWGLFSLISEIICCIFVIFLTVRALANLIKEKKTYFALFWNKLELIKVAFAFAAIGLYINRLFITKYAVEDLKNNEGNDADFSHVVSINDIFLMCIGVAMFCQQLQFLSLFKLHRRLSILGGTLRYSAASLVNFLVPFSVFFTAFFVLGYLVFGRLMWNYRDPIHSAFEQLATMLGKFRAKDMADISGIWGRVFLVVYNMGIIYLFLNMMITIIIDVHTEVHNDVLSREMETELIDLLLERIRGPKIKPVQETPEGNAAAVAALQYNWEPTVSPHK